MINRRDAIATATAVAGLGGLTALSAAAGVSKAGAGSSDDHAEPGTLAVLWTSGDPDVAHRVGLMYAHAAKTNGWFDEVRLIIWGPSQRILVGDKDLKAKVDQMRADGVIVEACIACASSFGLVETIEAMGIPVKGMGGPLTAFLRDPGVAVLSV